MADIYTVGAFAFSLIIACVYIWVCVAIDMVEFDTNTTVLPDEFIVDKLGMVPMVSTSCGESIWYSWVRAILSHIDICIHIHRLAPLARIVPA